MVCTLTPSREPVVEGAWFRPGQHVNAVGAPPRPDHREIDSAGMARARVFLDSRATAMHEFGDLLLAIAEGAITASDVGPEIGDVITGAAPGTDLARRDHPLQFGRDRDAGHRHRRPDPREGARRREWDWRSISRGKLASVRGRPLPRSATHTCPGRSASAPRRSAQTRRRGRAKTEVIVAVDNELQAIPARPS